MKVVSLVPSATETLLALGADVVACTRFCEQPGLPTVGGTKNPDVDVIVALAPDLVVMDVEENRREDADELGARQIPVLATNVTSVDDAPLAITALATAVGAEPPDWASAMTGARTSGETVAPARAADLLATPPAPPRTTAVVPIWRRPWMLLGPDTYGASLLERLGVITLAPSGAPYPEIVLEDAAAQLGEPTDLVIVPSEPYSFRAAHLDELAAAFERAHVVEVDGQDLFWWGIRTPAALDRLAGALAAHRPRPI